MSRVENRLNDLALPEPLVLPSPNRTSGIQVKNLLYLSGHGAALLEDAAEEDVVSYGVFGGSNA